MTIDNAPPDHTFNFNETERFLVVILTQGEFTYKYVQILKTKLLENLPYSIDITAYDLLVTPQTYDTLVTVTFNVS